MYPRTIAIVINDEQTEKDLRNGLFLTISNAWAPFQASGFVIDFLDGYSIYKLEQNIITTMMEAVSRNEWGQYLDRQNGASLTKLAETAEHMSILAGEIASYIEHRGADGCGDSGHEPARKAADNFRSKLRKLFGYNR